MYEIDVEFTVSSPLENSNGFGVFLLKKTPDFPAEFGSLMGYRADFNGIAIVLYKSS